MITINNPIEKGYTHHEIKRRLVDHFKTISYICMADERGSCYHTHIFAYFSSRVRWSTVKKHFTEAHIDLVQGLPSECIQYVSKSGKWKDSEKEETKIEGTFEEWGNRPHDTLGKKADMSLLYEMVKNGMSNSEILAMNQDYILQIDKLDKLRTMLLTDKYKNTRRLDLKVIYMYGATGSGKTRGILAKHGDSNVYRITDYQHPFDGYNCQPVIVFDEFRSQLRISDMLNYCDIYPIELPSRYANKFACYDTVYIVSNLCLEQQYEYVQQENLESWNAFLRRIHEVTVYDSGQSIIKYNSVEKYIHRNDGFRPLTQEEQLHLPF